MLECVPVDLCCTRQTECRKKVGVMVFESGTRKGKDSGICAAINMTVGNIHFKKRESNLVTSKSGLSSTQVYCLVVRDKENFGKDIKALLNEDCIT